MNTETDPVSHFQAMGALTSLLVREDLPTRCCGDRAYLSAVARAQPKTPNSGFRAVSRFRSHIDGTAAASSVREASKFI
jgi:hypothetical protein